MIAREAPARVLMTTDAVGGVWRYSLDLARALRAWGVHTTLAVMGPPPDATQMREAEKARVAVAQRAYRLEWMNDADDDVERAGAWLLALERARQPHLVHLNGYAHAALGWLAPVLVVAHSCVRTWWRAVKGTAAPDSYERYTIGVRDGLRAAAAVVAPTRAMVSALIDEYAIALEPQVIANGCAEPVARQPLWHTKQPMVLAAGRVWDEGKNIGSLCAIAPQLTWPVVVAGDRRGPDGTDVPLPSVRTLGLVPSTELRAWYRRAAIYALPARYEPFGLSALEAARAGCALVLGDISSLRENWDGAAIFVPPNDRAALAGAIQGLIDDRDRRRQFGEQAWTRSKAFTIDRTAAEYLSLYRRLIA